MRAESVQYDPALHSRSYLAYCNLISVFSDQIFETIVEKENPGIVIADKEKYAWLFKELKNNDLIKNNFPGIEPDNLRMAQNLASSQPNLKREMVEPPKLEDCATRIINEVDNKGLRQQLIGILSSDYDIHNYDRSSDETKLAVRIIIDNLEESYGIKLSQPEEVNGKIKELARTEKAKAIGVRQPNIDPSNLRMGHNIGQNLGVIQPNKSEFDKIFESNLPANNFLISRLAALLTEKTEKKNKNSEEAKTTIEKILTSESVKSSKDSTDIHTECCDLIKFFSDQIVAQIKQKKPNVRIDDEPMQRWLFKQLKNNKIIQDTFPELEPGNVQMRQNPGNLQPNLKRERVDPELETFAGQLVNEAINQDLGNELLALFSSDFDIAQHSNSSEKTRLAIGIVLDELEKNII